MKFQKLFLSLTAVLALGFSAQAEEALSEINPFDPNIEQALEEFDVIYEQETGESARIDTLDSVLNPWMASCYRQSCAVWARVSKANQTLSIYVNGELQGTYPASTGMKGFTTPNFDTHPNGRIYNKYTSRKYPEGDYNGLGNMPYAVFIRGGFAIHGTPEGNWRRLGTPASHGCIRVHPDVGYYFNRLVRSHGIRKVWITVQ